MKVKLDIYKKIKGLMFFAKQTFLNENGQEIIPTLDNLVGFEKKFNIVQKLLMELEQELLKTLGEDEDNALHRKSED